MTSNMNPGGWYSKTTMMRDLAQATGLRHIDDTCFVVGERPPPRRSYHEDISDMMYRYGDIPDNVTNEVMTPDLDGIREMLRMVDNEEVDKSKPDNSIKDTPCTDNILLISKLNPEVQEFKPTTGFNAAGSTENGVKMISSKVEKDNKDSQSSQQCNKDCAKNLQDVDNENKANGHLALPADIEEMREKLKTKISNNSKTNCVKSKREKNLAMASLLKLYSQPPNGISNIPNMDTTDTQKPHETKNVPLKLLPPDYYETSNNAKEIRNGETNSDKIITTDKCEKIKVETSINGSVSNIKSNDIDGTSGVNEKVTTTNVQSIDDDDVQSSVQKVQNWLAGMESSKNEKDLASTSERSVSTPKKEKKVGPPTLFLGPITFKRKAAVKSNSPSLISESTSRRTPCTTYVPSAYASELSRSYNEKAKAKKVIEDDIWSRLYTELDKRDEDYRKKKAEEEAINSSSDLTSDVPTQ